MILPTNPRSAIYAVALWIYQHGPAKAPAVVGALGDRFSIRTITDALSEMLRVDMAFSGEGEALALRAHVIRFFDLETADRDQAQDAPIVSVPYRADWRAGTLGTKPAIGTRNAPAMRRPIREGADDYKSWPSRHVPTKGAA